MCTGYTIVCVAHGYMRGVSNHFTTVLHTTKDAGGYARSNELTTICQSARSFAPCAEELRQLGAVVHLTVLRFVPVRSYALD
jgi:hypothetical protein